MKFALLLALTVVSFSSFANHILSSQSTITRVSNGCSDRTSGRNINFGITKMCFDYDVHTVQTQILTDPESRGAPVPGSRPFTIEGTERKEVCNYGSSYGDDVQRACEGARRQFLAHLRRR